MKKKNVKTSIVILLMVVAGIAYYYYLSNRTPSVDATQQAVDNQELGDLLSRDVDNNYPQSPKEVVKLYMRIAKQYYGNNISEDQIDTLGKQARRLFDDELKSKQSEDEFLKALKQEISDYNNQNRYISDYKIESSRDVKYKTLNNKKYASIDTLFYIRQSDNLIYSYTRFTLRQDNNGRWKILYWELYKPDDNN